MFGAHLDIGDELTTDASTWAVVVDGRRGRARAGRLRIAARAAALAPSSAT